MNTYLPYRSTTNFANYIDERKAQIVMAVLKLADRFGIKGVTTKRIAQEVGFVEGAIYKHVKSKKELYETILDLYARMLDERFLELESLGLSPDRYLREWMHFAVFHIEEVPGIYRVLFSDELYVNSGDLATKFKNILVTLTQRLETLIQIGVRQGRFRRNIKPEWMAKLYLGVIHTAFTLWNVFDGRQCRFNEIALPLFEEYMKSVTAPKKKKP